VPSPGRTVLCILLAGRYLTSAFRICLLFSPWTSRTLGATARPPRRSAEVRRAFGRSSAGFRWAFCGPSAVFRQAFSGLSAGLQRAFGVPSTGFRRAFCGPSAGLRRSVRPPIRPGAIKPCNTDPRTTNH